MPDTNLIHADIFFFISTIALVLITIGIVTSFVYIVGILKNVRDITEKGKAEWAAIVADSEKLRAAIRDEGVKWKTLVSPIHDFFEKHAVKKAKTAKTKKV